MQLNDRLAEMMELPLTDRRVMLLHGRLADLVKIGLPARSFDGIANYTHLGRARLAAATTISRRTLERRIARKERFLVDESDRLARVARLYAAAEEVLGSREAAERWMEAPNRSLGGARPIDEIVTELGARDVEDTLGRIREGVFD